METMHAHRRLAWMAVFARVVELASFSAAARALGVSKSAVSKRIAEIERGLGVRLLLRTTRRLSLTEAGNLYYKSCARVIAEADAVEHAVGDLHRKPVGMLRINAPVEFGASRVAPVLAEFLRLYPDVRAELVLQDDLVDLVSTGTDIAIRIGRLSDSSLIARRIAPIEFAIVASPDYLARRGRPRQPRDLRDHDFLVYSLVANPRRLVLHRRRKRCAVIMKGPLVSNSGNALRSAALAGLGIGCFPRFYVSDDIAAGALVSIVSDWSLPAVSLNAVYVAGQAISLKQRLFIDHLIDRLRERCNGDESSISTLPRPIEPGRRPPPPLGRRAQAAQTTRHDAVR